MRLLLSHRLEEGLMSRLTISLSLASLILGLCIPEQTADACGVKLAIKTARQRQRAKHDPVGASDRTVIATRAARPPIAVGPSAPRITIKTKAAEAKPQPVAANTTAAPAPTTVAKTASSPPTVGKEPVKTPATTVARTEPTPATKDAPTKAPAATTTVAAATPVSVPPRKNNAQRKPPTVATASGTKPASAVTQPAVTTTVTPAKAETSAVLDAEVYYGLGRTVADDKTNLDNAVNWLTANPTVQATIEGYSDPQGWPDRNQLISRMRAETAVKYLVEHGI